MHMSKKKMIGDSGANEYMIIFLFALQKNCVISIVMQNPMINIANVFKSARNVPSSDGCIISLNRKNCW